MQEVLPEKYASVLLTPKKLLFLFSPSSMINLLQLSILAEFVLIEEPSGWIILRRHCKWTSIINLQEAMYFRIYRVYIKIISRT